MQWIQNDISAYGFTQPSRSHSNNPPEEGGYGRFKNISPTPSSYINPPSATNQHIEVNSATKDENELEDDARSGERPEEHPAPST